ncbi:MAG: glycosyltransferase family 2 protein [Armatimonadota bacterium]
MPPSDPSGAEPLGGAVPRVALVTPLHNKAPYVAEMIASVRAQTFTDWHWVIVDDGSTDDSFAVACAAAAGDPRIRCIGQANAGVSAARLAGFEATEPGSEYVLFPDADDLLEPEMLAALVAALDADETASMAYVSYRAIDADGRPHPMEYPRYWVPCGPFARQRDGDAGCMALEGIVAWAPVIEPAGMMRRSVFVAGPGWDRHLGQHGEGVLLFGYCALRGRVAHVDRPLYRYRRFPGQSSSIGERVAVQERKTYWQLHEWPGDAVDRARMRRALRFGAGAVLGSVAMRSGLGMLRSGRFARGARLWCAGGARCLAAALLPGWFLRRCVREWRADFRARGIPWEPCRARGGMVANDEDGTPR